MPAARRLRLALTLWSACALLSGVTRANHPTVVPEPRTILLQKGNPSVIALGTRFGGYFLTRDGGQRWHWLCESGMGYDDQEVYPGAILANGKMVVSTGFAGLSISTDGCGWTQWLPSAAPFVADLEMDVSGSYVVALDAHAEGNAFSNQLWMSDPELATWQPLGSPFAADLSARTLALAENGDLHVGASGPGGAMLLHSIDDGLSFTRYAVPAAADAVPRVLAVDAGRLFVLVDHLQSEGATAGDELLVSHDGGQSYETLLLAAGDLAATALAPEGTRLVLGGHQDGIYSLDLETLALEQVSTQSVHVLAFSAEGKLYAIGHEEVDGFSLGVSSDGGRSFFGLLALCQVLGPLECSSDSSVGAQCLVGGETGWEVRKEAYPSPACQEVGAPASVPAADPQPDAGSNSTPAAPLEGAAPETPTDGHGERIRGQTTCSLARAPSTSGWFFGLLVLGLSRRRAPDSRSRRFCSMGLQR